MAIDESKRVVAELVKNLIMVVKDDEHVQMPDSMVTMIELTVSHAYNQGMMRGACDGYVDGMYAARRIYGEDMEK